MPLPISHGLVGATVVALWRPRSRVSLDWPQLFCGAILAVSPDADFLLVWGFHQRGWHRSFTHSILMAVIITLLMLAMRGLLETRTALAYGTAFLSHGLLDFATTRLGGGVQLLWPFSGERLRLGLIGISEFPHGLGFVELLKSALIEMLVFVPVLLIVLGLRRFVLGAEPQSIT
ncbi:MAG: metal-dependent hydrolase [Acidobacteria bacterium]|nr:metal-dependent hydrolase [Acidobacteriota bacterium]